MYKPHSPCAPLLVFNSDQFGQEQQAKYKEFTKFSEKKLKTAEFAIVAICLCLVQLLPVLALTLVSGKAVRLAIIVVLILLVSILNAAFANTVRATNFGAIAAYVDTIASRFLEPFNGIHADLSIGIQLLLLYSSVRAIRRSRYILRCAFKSFMYCGYVASS